MIKKYFMCLFFMSCALIPKSGADIVMPGMDVVDYCLKMDNISVYPEYDFVVFPVKSNLAGYEILEEDNCVRFYKMNEPKIYAVRKGLLLEIKLGDSAQAQKAFFNNNPHVWPSKASFDFKGTVKSSQKISAITEILHIEKLDPKDFIVVPIKQMIEYSNGTVREKNSAR